MAQVTAEVRTQAELQSLSEKPHASHWHAKDVQTWLVHKVRGRERHDIVY